jgi:hypothetical protein
MLPDMPESKIEDWALKLIDSPKSMEFTIHTYNSLMCNLFQMLIAEGKLSRKDFQFYWNDTPCTINEDGFVIETAEQCRFLDNVCRRMLKANIKRSKE